MRSRLIAVGVLLLAGCTGSGDAETPQVPAVRIYAAASLQAAFDRLSDGLAEGRPDVVIADVTYDGSSVLATQLLEGAVADVFATADRRSMQLVADAGLLDGEPRIFATNTLRIAVAPGNPLEVTGLADLTRSGLQLVVCAPEVPCGRASAEVFAAAGIQPRPVSEEQNVSAVLRKVAAGEADAGLVYRTDVLAADGAVDGVDFPEAITVVNEYPIAMLRDAPSRDAGTAFVEFVTSPAGQQLLADLGFGPPR